MLEQNFGDRGMLWARFLVVQSYHIIAGDGHVIAGAGVEELERFGEPHSP